MKTILLAVVVVFIGPAVVADDFCLDEHPASGGHCAGGNHLVLAGAFEDAVKKSEDRRDARAERENLKLQTQFLKQQQEIIELQKELMQLKIEAEKRDVEAAKLEASTP